MNQSIEYSKVFQDALDQQMIAQSTSGWMELNADLVKYEGGNEVKIPRIVMEGLADYDRENGFQRGNIQLSWDTYKLTKDRGRSFSFDAMDVDETNMALSAASVMAEFQATEVIPEVDAYRYSRIAQLAIENNRVRSGIVLDSTNVLDALLEDIYAIQDEVGDNIPLVIALNMQNARILNTADRIQKTLDTTNFQKGEVDMTVRSLDGNPIIKVPSSRMKTSYIFKDGKTTNQESGGFEASPDAKNINWIIAAKNVPIAISKTSKVRIFEPNFNIQSDAWKVDYRKYHDLWIQKNKMKGVFVNIKETL